MLTRRTFQDWLATPRRPCAVVGILNTTPDSFSDGGRFTDVGRAVDYALRMLDDGAQWIDVGGESTRPGSEPVDEQAQISRTGPVIAALRGKAPHAMISIDTTRATVARAALEAGADVVNDISAGRDDAAMFELVARHNAAIILMHMRGTPATMQENPTYADVVVEVRMFLAERFAVAKAAGVEANKILIDPGIGFGKTVAHNIALLRATNQFASDAPTVIGTSRKGFIGKITGETDPAHRTFGTAATVAWAVEHGASAVRVHDVAEMSCVVKMVEALTRV